MCRPVTYAGLWRRFIAYLIDQSVLGASAVAVGLNARGADSDPFDMQLLFLALYAGFAAIYYTVGVYRYGKTLGKAALGVAVIDETTHGLASLRQALLRSLGSALSSFLWFGYGVAAFHPRKKTFHDLISGTVVIVKRNSNKDHFGKSVEK